MDDSTRTDHLIERFRARSVDAIVSLAATEDDREVLVLTATHVPVVLAVRLLHDSGLPTVRCDDHLGASLAAGHLADLGHVRVAQVQGPQRSQLFADPLAASPTPPVDAACDPAHPLHRRPRHRRRGAATGDGDDRRRR